MNCLLNLNKESFPVNIKKDLKDINQLKKLGKIQGNINLDLSIEKISRELFLTQGSVYVVFQSECQRCFKKTDIKLNLNLNVGIKDIKYENLDKKGSLEVHYQNIDNFDINCLVKEEIILNFPHIVYCCELHNEDLTIERDPKKITPFKKIRDLIK